MHVVVGRLYLSAHPIRAEPPGPDPTPRGPARPTAPCISARQWRSSSPPPSLLSRMACSSPRSASVSDSERSTAGRHPASRRHETASSARSLGTRRSKSAIIRTPESPVQRAIIAAPLRSIVGMRRSPQSDDRALSPLDLDRVENPRPPVDAPQAPEDRIGFQQRFEVSVDQRQQPIHGGIRGIEIHELTPLGERLVGLRSREQRSAEGEELLAWQASPAQHVSSRAGGGPARPSGPRASRATGGPGAGSRDSRRGYVGGRRRPPVPGS